MVRVKIIPQSTRAKNRVREHGEVMILLQEGSFDGQQAILVESTGLTWGPLGSKEKWAGWFTINEATWEIVNERAG